MSNTPANNTITPMIHIDGNSFKTIALQINSELNKIINLIVSLGWLVIQFYVPFLTCRIPSEV